MDGTEDRIEVPFTPHALARAIRWAKEWYVHEKQRDSMTTAVAVAFFDVAADDYERAVAGATVARTVLSLRDVQTVVDELALPSPPDPETVKTFPEAVERNLRGFRHYFRFGRHWYRFTFAGPRQRPGATERHAASYYLSVHHERIPRGMVPCDRLRHRPLNRDRRQIAATAPRAFPDAIQRRAALFAGVKTLLRGDQAVLSIQGVAGVGKTDFVAALIEHTSGYFPDGHLYLHASVGGQRRAVADVLREAIIRLDATAVPASDINGLTARFRALAGRHACLIVCEDVLVADDALPFLPPSGCALVVTSRSRIAIPGAAVPFVLATPPPADAAHFLRTLAPRIDVAADVELIKATEAAVPDPQLARRLLTSADVIAQLVGDLPLALHVCGRYLAQHPDVLSDAFARRLLDERYRIALTGAQGEALSVEASVSVSYDALSATEQRAFRRLGVVPSSFDRVAAIVVAGDPTRLTDMGGPTLASELVQQGLVSFDPATERYRMHELLRAYGRSRMSDDEYAAARAALAQTSGAFGTRLLLAVQRGETQRFIEAERIFSEELPNLSLIVGELLADIATVDVLFETSSLVLGIAPLLLRTAPDRLLAWSECLWRGFALLADAGAVHQQRFPTARLHSHAGRDWGITALRRVQHAYHCGLAAESLYPVSPPRALHWYAAAVAEFAKNLPDHESAASIARSAEGRAARLYRSADVRAETDVVRFVSRALEQTEAGMCGLLLHELVIAQLHAESGRADDVDFCAAILQKWQQLTSHEPPYAAAFLLDAVGEHAAVWFWAQHTLVTSDGAGRNALELHEEIAREAAVAGRMRGVLVEDVSRRFRQRPPDWRRTPLPVAAGYALMRTGDPSEARRFFDAAMRVAEATSDVDGMIAARAGRAHAYEALEQADSALQDWVWLLRISPSAECEEAVARLRDRVASR